MVSPNENASSDSSEESEDFQPPAPREARTARKSTSRPASKTRRQAARNANKALRTTADHFIGDFNPETSVREKRKLSRKINPPSRRPAGALYDENGVHIVTGIDLCDCLQEDCVGCFFVECTKCGSNKCGTECRVHRKYLVEQIQYEGYDQIIKNPLMKH